MFQEGFDNFELYQMEKIEIMISAETVYGVRHGLETVAQLIAYNSDKDVLKVWIDPFHYIYLWHIHNIMFF